jgi:PetM family of cytochrome b6f complex subunit 7
MGPEFMNALFLLPVLVMVGLGLGFLLLKIQGAEE